MMAKLTKYEPKERVELADNIYIAKLLSVDVKVWAPDNHSLNFKFELSQPPFIGQKVWVWGSTGTAPTPKARLTAWGAALGYTREQLSDPAFDTEVLVGSYVKVFVKTWAKENGEMKQGVTDLIPLTEAEIEILQSWLAKANVVSPTNVTATQVAPAAVPVSVAPTLPTIPVAQIPAPVAPVVAPAPVPVTSGPVVAKRVNDFPF